jgi:uncharacterized protein YkwD
MDRRLFLGGAAALCGGAATAASPIDPIAPYARRLQTALDRTGGGRFVRDSEDALHAAHQKARTDHGLPPLLFHPGLAMAARAHAADQSLRVYFGHDSPDGFSVAERVGLLARTFVGLPGENIIDLRGGWLGAEPDRLMDGWMDSPGHRDNILKDSFTHLGLGVVQTGRRTVAVAVFGQAFAALDRPVPLAPTGAELAAVLEAAQPAIYSYDLSPVGGSAMRGAFSQEQPPQGLRPGAYTLRPRLRDGNRFTVVYGPIVDMAG